LALWPKVSLGYQFELGLRNIIPTVWYKSYDWFSQTRARQAVSNAFGSVMEILLFCKNVLLPNFSRGIFILERPITSREFFLMDPYGKMLNWLV